MTLLILVFLTILLMTFGIVAFTLRPKPEQTALDHRINTLVSQHTVAPSEAGALLLLQARRTGPFVWTDDLLEKFSAFKSLELLIQQAKVDSSVSAVCLTILVVGLATLLLVYAITSNLLIALGVSVLLAYTPLFRLQFRRRRRVAAFDAVLPDAVELCSRSLRAGHSLIGAIGNVADQSAEPVKSEFAEVFRLQNFGLPLRDALMQMMARMPSIDLHVVVTGILVQKDTGGNLAEIMDHISDVIRERVRIKGDIQVHTAQGRLTGWILCLLPVALLLGINVLNPGYSKVLFHDPTGQKLLYVSAALLVTGGLIIRHIINGIEV